MKYYLSALLTSFLVSLYTLSFAQTTNASIKISNEDNKPVTLSAADIKALPHITLEIKGHDEKMHTYSGVAIAVLLAKAGVQSGDAVKKKTVSSYMLITAADNYTVVYALAEADSVLSDKKIILADTQDGQPLPDHAGPFQIISTGEKIHARMIRQVTTIAIHKAI